MAEGKHQKRGDGTQVTWEHHAFFFYSLHQNSLLQQAHQPHQTLFHFQTNYYFPLISLHQIHCNNSNP